VGRSHSHAKKIGNGERSPRSRARRRIRQATQQLRARVAYEGSTTWADWEASLPRTQERPPAATGGPSARPVFPHVRSLIGGNATGLGAG
jgi:hypothetical protein